MLIHAGIGSELGQQWKLFNAGEVEFWSGFTIFGENNVRADAFVFSP
ncbi:hypothetical protein [Prosthecobacter sp.]